MAQITLTYDVRNDLANKALDFVKALGVFEVIDEKRYNEETEKVIRDVKSGKATTTPWRELKKDL